ncbi:MAG: metal-dependent hydrolase [Acidobacteriaceae bacterium]
MFVGHFGVAFAAKKAAPRTNLATAILAAQFLDVLWPIFVLSGFERVRIAPGLMTVSAFDFLSYPWTHSLLMSIVWAALFGTVHYAFRRDTRTALVLAAVVLSHWFLDLATHRPDLQLAPGLPTRYGLGLWNSRFGTYVVELAIYFGGIVLYLRTTRARDRIGRWGLIAYVALLFMLYIANLEGPPPPDIRTGLIAMLISMPPLLAWAWWLDRHRIVADANGFQPQSKQWRMMNS